ncbi:hypothetical protein PNEG_03316 [Pneumocystis murina B123]|uniref:C2H2-type domain-containing protein n=1 Tax=Pneumocystis murina (strain B123) TaxID=1069680 RepID=M7P3Q5_PNEMU|nr:hypothetical protein PNEG_03316 [Pneumocystis murina B123]EMR08490.1 hypothetical protein PNEG_03316 [Pneumocystis murina B123]
MFLNTNFIKDLEEENTKITKRTIEEDFEKKKRQKKIYKCTFEGCNKAYSKPCRIEEHIRSHTGERPFVCNYKGCEKAFFRKSHLKAHIHSHINERPYFCRFKDCIARFNTNQHLKRHEAIHLRETPYKCTKYPPCTAEFHKHHQLLIHIANTHTHKKPFLCEYDQCKKSFDTGSKLNSHISRIHVPIPSYFCEIEDCNQKEGFSKLSLLQKHLKNDHCVICKVCNKKFSTNTQLKLHLQVHEKSLEERRLYHCSINNCQKSFTRSFALQKHIEIVHEQKKEFVCNIDNCGMKFGYKKLLIAHKLYLHNQSEENYIKKIRSKVAAKVGPVSLLTGFDYSESGRDISCLVQGCKWQFLREYDLKRHIKSYHSDIVI